MTALFLASPYFRAIRKGCEKCNFCFFFFFTDNSCKIQYLKIWALPPKMQGVATFRASLRYGKIAKNAICSKPFTSLTQKNPARQGYWAFAFPAHKPKKPKNLAFIRRSVSPFRLHLPWACFTGPRLHYASKFLPFCWRTKKPTSPKKGQVG